MTFACIAFAAGVLALQLLPALPGAAWVGLFAFFSLLFFRRMFLFLPAAFAVGLWWGVGLAHLKLADRLAPELEGRDIELVGVVASLPATGERSLRFEFEPETALPPAAAPLPRKILLSWYRSLLDEEQPSLATGPVHPGERWRFAVRLRRPHGNFNPHGFDYEAWLLERGAGATGYVRSSRKAFPEKLGERDSFSDRIEQV